MVDLVVVIRLEFKNTKRKVKIRKGLYALPDTREPRYSNIYKT
jgi:hypothetical protein